MSGRFAGPSALAFRRPKALRPACGTKEMPGLIVLRDLRGRPQLTATLAALLLRGANDPNIEDTRRC